jgi:hypothetical protein
VRSRRLRALFNTDWLDPVCHDLVLNSTLIGIKRAGPTITELVSWPELHPTAQAEIAFQELLIASPVQSKLITSPKTRNIILNVRSDAGKVTISGILADPDLQKGNRPHR